MKRLKTLLIFSISISFIFLINQYDTVYASYTNETVPGWYAGNFDDGTIPQRLSDFDINVPDENRQPIYHYGPGSMTFRYSLDASDLVDSEGLSTDEINPPDGIEGISYRKMITVNGKKDNQNNSIYKNGGFVTFIQLKNGQPTGFKLRSKIEIFSGVDDRVDSLPKSIYLDDKNVVDGKLPLGSLMDKNGNTYAFYLKNDDNDKPSSIGQSNVKIQREEQGTFFQEIDKGDRIHEVDPKLTGGWAEINSRHSEAQTYQEDSLKNIKLNILPSDGEDVHYNFIFEDKDTGEIIGDSQHGVAKNGTQLILKSVNLPAGYQLDSSNDKQRINMDEPTKIVKVSQDDKTEGYGNIQYDIVFKDKDTGKILNDDQTGIGKPGSSVQVVAPKGYEIAYHPVMNYTLSSAYPNKLIYVTKKNNITHNYNYTVKYIDKSTGTIIDTQYGNDYPNTNIRIVPPIGYTFDNISSSTFNLNKNGMVYVSYIDKLDTPYNVFFVDQSNNRIISSQSGMEKSGSLILLTPPNGYAISNEDDLYYRVDKNTTSTKVYVQKLIPKYSKDSQFNGVISTYSDNSGINVYDDNGNLRHNIMLSSGSSWISTSIKTINGINYYQIAPNEYIRSDDSFAYIPTNKIITTHGGNSKSLYNSRGKLIKNVELAANSSWYTDKISVINGKMMYRVSTDQWIASYNVK